MHKKPLVKRNAKITLSFNNMQVVGYFYFGMLDGNCPIINVKKLQPEDSANAERHYLHKISPFPFRIM